MSECLFCKIASGKIPSEKVAESEKLFAFRDINPQAPTHILIIPKKHIENNLSLKDEDKELIGEVHLLANQIAMKEGIDKSGFRLVTNNGSNAGQAVFHIHFHLLGGRIMLWPPG
ncbi:MAG: histidine triad nucleotide-binding protein [Nitrospinota bacterium]|nr:histidine triad nucleotide-binding protein [Nitrospinota bacterium]MDH5757600.1 histidine triad nucleotide-binding protein [Nitrospinota bacterium]